MKKGKSSAPTAYLKSKNAISLWSFIGVHLAIFLSLSIGKQWNSASVNHFWGRITTKDGLIAACMPIITIVLTGLLGDTGKARLIFWRWRDPLPGCRVFTELMAADPRIDHGILKTKHGTLPSEPHAQNALWYRLYKKHLAKANVSESHRIYLLMRDMTVVSAIFAVLLPVGVFMVSVDRQVVIIYSAALIAEYMILATSARNYGERFVLNVLAEEGNAP
jgi:hypothetical protein